MRVGTDGFGRPDVRVQFQTEDGATVLLQYTGLVQATGKPTTRHPSAQMRSSRSPLATRLRIRAVMRLSNLEVPLPNGLGSSPCFRSDSPINHSHSPATGTPSGAGPAPFTRSQRLGLLRWLRAKKRLVAKVVVCHQLRDFSLLRGFRHLSGSPTISPPVPRQAPQYEIHSDRTASFPSL
jgi:hypothetical protein